MPNWCLNDVTLRHTDPAMIIRAAQAFDRGELLNEFHPLPENLREDGSWYDWCIRNWGTKWDVGGDGRNPITDPNELEMSFESAWAPPIEAYQVMCELGFEIQAFYYEPGMGFVGKFTGDSEGDNDDYYEFGDWSAEQVRTEIPELDERFGISQWIEDSQEDLEE